MKTKEKYAARGICSRCLKSKQLRLSSPHWCTECYKTYQREYSRNYSKNEPAIRARAKYAKTEKSKLVKKNYKYIRRRSMRNGAIKIGDWRALCARYNHKCLACGLEKPLTIDHVIPLSKGGSNTIDNVQPLCASCNSIKGTNSTDYR